MREVQKNRSTTIRIEWSEFRGESRLDAREFYLADDDTWRPTKRGLSLPATLVAPFLAALTAEAKEYEDEKEDEE